MDSCINRIKDLETLFSDNKYNGSGEKPFEICEGTIPVILSAPHAVNHYREGKIKWADMFTGGIARYLQEVTGCHIIYSCKFSEADPNYNEPGTNLYHDAIIEYVKKHKIAVLLDLHGAAKTREYAIEMGTAPKRNHASCAEYEPDPSLHEHKFIADLIKNTFDNEFSPLETKKKLIWKNKIFNAGEQNTVTKFISENTSVACIQLEINQEYRNPDYPQQLEALINGFKKIIDELAGINWEE